jgi:nicotinamide mononucleotide (NMN) deamidase PncC
MSEAEAKVAAAEEMISAAESAGPDESPAGQVYATVAVAQALLAVREEIRSLKIRLS